MFENYTHSQEDLAAIEEALEYLEKPELDFVFAERRLIQNVSIVSFDSQEIFLWTRRAHPGLEEIPGRLKKYRAYRVKHELQIKDEDQKDWQNGLKREEIAAYLPFELGTLLISGGLLTPFTKIHQKLRETGKWSLDPYATRESYLATVIHEIGHVYYGQHESKHLAHKRELLGYFELARNLYRGKKGKNLGKLELKFPKFYFVSEAFAFCTDYYAASHFWPQHKADIDRNNEDNIQRWIKEGNFSFLAESHYFAAVMGKIFLEKFPDTWPGKLLQLGEF